MRAGLLLTLAAADFFHDVVVPEAAGPGGCKTCVSLSSQALNQLLNIVLQAGVAGGCGKLCAHLPSKLEQRACDLVCTLAGAKAFAKAIEKADLDPIYFCELVHACEPGPDGADVRPLSAHAEPATLKKGETVQLVADFSVVNASGVGEFDLYVNGPVTDAPIGQGFVLPAGLPVGQQSLAVQLTPKDVQPSPQGGNPVIWHPGVYQFEVRVCQGECGSKHPHSKNFGSVKGNFTLTAYDAALVV